MVLERQYSWHNIHDPRERALHRRDLPAHDPRHNPSDFWRYNYDPAGMEITHLPESFDFEEDSELKPHQRNKVLSDPHIKSIVKTAYQNEMNLQESFDDYNPDEDYQYVDFTRIYANSDYKLYEDSYSGLMDHRIKLFDDQDYFSNDNTLARKQAVRDYMKIHHKNVGTQLYNDLYRMPHQYDNLRTTLPFL